MGKSLILAEKPSVGREIAKVLKVNNNKGSYIENNKYIVTWALGHLVELQSPEGYDVKYKKLEHGHFTNASKVYEAKCNKEIIKAIL